MTIDTFDNCARQEIETMPTDTWTSFEEVTPPDSSNVGEELNIGLVLGWSLSLLKKLETSILHLLRRMVLDTCSIK